ncbi:MAG TPA: hypothetical protein VGD81_05295 [Opitutaceae bacterium]
MSSNDTNNHRSAAPHNGLVREVRYSLPELLAELKLEHSAGIFAQEKLSQVEISKMFASTPKHRVKKSSQ